jgi:hypothetical protein
MGGVTFREVMTGQLTAGETDPRAAYSGHGTSGIRLMATINIADLRTFFEDPTHSASMVADLDMPRIGGRLTNVTGRFGLFVPTGDARSTQMLYELPLTIEGREHFLRGVKNIRVAAPWRMWPATTTLLTTLHEGDTDVGKVVAAGILRIRPLGVIGMLSTLRGIGEHAVGYAGPVVEFLTFFVGGLFSTYVLRRRA